MSQLLDDIAKIQAQTGCSVLEGKKFYDQAGGNIDLAIMIARDEMAKSRPASQNSYNQQYQRPMNQNPQNQYGQQPSYGRQRPQSPYGQNPYGNPQPQQQYGQPQHPQYGQPQQQQFGQPQQMQYQQPQPQQFSEQAANDLDIKAKETAVANTYKVLKMSGIMAFVMAGFFLLFPAVMFGITGYYSFLVPILITLLIAAGALIWTGVVSFQRIKYLDRLPQECNVPKYIALQALTINKWRYEKAKATIQSNFNKQ